MEKIHTGRYVVVNPSTGVVELKLTSGGTVAYFSNNAELAMLSGNVVQVNLKNGSVVFYKLTNDGYSVTGPYMSL
jgi:hypothetical protein